MLELLLRKNPLTFPALYSGFLWWVIFSFSFVIIVVFFRFPSPLLVGTGGVDGFPLSPSLSFPSPSPSFPFPSPPAGGGGFPLSPSLSFPSPSSSFPFHLLLLVVVDFHYLHLYLSHHLRRLSFSISSCWWWWWISIISIFIFSHHLRRLFPFPSPPAGGTGGTGGSPSFPLPLSVCCGAGFPLLSCSGSSYLTSAYLTPILFSMYFYIFI